MNHEAVTDAVCYTLAIVFAAIGFACVFVGLDVSPLNLCILVFGNFFMATLCAAYPMIESMTRD